MHGRKTVMGAVLCLWLHVSSFACSGSAIGTAGNNSAAQVSVTPAKAGSPAFDSISGTVTTAILNIVELLVVEFIRLDPLTATVAPTLLNADNAANIEAAVEAKKREGETGTSNVNAPSILQQIEADENAQYRKAP